tara:strand:+ start:1081 stop:2892 length:1812 start_codon:yes stop_codon:yes gene_type:complete
MAANKDSLFKIGKNVIRNTVNTGRNLLNKVDFANIVPDPTPQQIEADYISKLGNFAQPGISKGQEALQGLGNFAQENFAQPGISKGKEALQGLGNFAQENLDRVSDFAQQSVQPAKTNVMEQGDLYGPIDQEPQQQGFLRPAIDFAKSPEGKQMLADALRLSFAATRKDPIVGGTIAKGLTDELAQRPIQAAKREKAAQDKEMFDLNKLLKLTELEALVGKPQADADKAEVVRLAALTKATEAQKKDHLDYIRDLKKDKTTPLSKNEDINKYPQSVIVQVDNPATGETSTYINRGEYKLLFNAARKDLGRIKKTRQQLDTVESAIDKLLTVNKDGNADLTQLGHDAAADNIMDAGLQSFLSRTGGYGSTAAKAYIDQIKANLGFKELQDMRDNSKTGSALGSVSNIEIGFLQAAQSILRMNLKTEDMINALKELKQRVNLVRKDISGLTNANDIIFASEFNAEKAIEENQRVDVADGVTMDIGEKPKAEDIVPDSPMTPTTNNIVPQQQLTTPVNEIPTQNVLPQGLENGDPIVFPQGPRLNTLQGFNPAGGQGLQMELLKALAQQNARLPRTNILTKGGPIQGGQGIQNALLSEILNRGRRP